MIERPVSVLRSVLRFLAGDECSRLSVSFGEWVPAEALRRAWHAVASARPRLRCGYRKVPGEGLRAIENPQAEPQWQELDWSSFSKEKIAALWRAEVEGAKAPDPSLAPPLRLAVIALPDRTTHLLATHPQFVFDEEDWFDVLCELLDALCGSHPRPVEAGLALPQGQPIWDELLRDFQPAPLRFYGPGEAGEFRCEERWERGPSAELAKACREAGADVPSAVLGCWSALLARLTGQPRPLLWVPVGETISLFQPFRLPALENPGLRELMVVAAAEQRRRAEARPEPLESLGLQPGEATSLVRFLPPSLNERISDALPRWVNIDARLNAPPLHSLELGVRLGLRLEFCLRGRGLPKAVAAQILQWLHVFLEGIAGGRRVADLALAAPAELPPPSSPEPAPVEALFAEVAGQQPEALAVEDPSGASLSFREVEDYASILSAWLYAKGLGEGWIAGICLSPSPWVPVAWMALLRAGNTLLPLDPEAPADWLRKKLTDTDAQFVVCDSSTAFLFEGVGQQVVILDQEWEAISSSPVSEHFPNPARLALILGGCPHACPPMVHIPQPALSSASLRFGRLYEAKAGHRVEISAPPGTGHYADALLGSLVAGATAIFQGASSPSHLRGNAGALRARLNEEPEDNFRSVCSVAIDVREQPLDLATLQRIRAVVGDQCRVVTFASPCDLSYLGLSGPAQISASVHSVLSVGKASRVAGVRFVDNQGCQPPPGFPGRLSFQLPGSSARMECMSAWQGTEGDFHLLYEDEGLWALTVAALSVPGVTDAAVRAGQSPRLYYSAKENVHPDQLAGKLALALPGRSLPRKMIRVPSIPRRLGMPDWEALEPDRESQPTAKVEEKAPPLSSSASPATAEAVPISQPPKEETFPWPLKAAEPSLASKSAAHAPQSLLLELAGPPDLPRLIFVHASGRSPQDCAPLLPFLCKDWQVCGIRRYQGDPPDSTQLARGLVNDPLTAEEPFHLLGVGAGGLLAFDLARALRAAGRSVPFLVVAGAIPLHERPRNWLESLTRGMRAESGSPLRGPCGIILTKDLPKDAESRWLELAPDALCLSLNCRYSELLGEGAEAFASAIASFMSAD